MTDARLAAIVDRLRRFGTDTQDVEVKASGTALPTSVRETLSAFSNGGGGLLVLGLSEADDFAPVPGFDPARTCDALARMCRDDVEPPLRSEIEIFEVAGSPVVAMQVDPLDPLEQPCFVRTRGAYNGSFIRTADGDRRLSSYEITQLLSNRRQPADDAAAVDRATPEDLDPSKVRALLERVRAQRPRSLEGLDDLAALARLGAMVEQDGAIRPTLAGLLCLGRYPQQFVPQLFVSFVALPGSVLGAAAPDGTRFLDNLSCDGTVPDMVSLVLAAARRNMRVATAVDDTGRRDRYDYPIEVVRELVVNALMHRDYSPGSRGTQIQVELYPDRLVVKSPGGLYGGVVAEQLGVEEVSSTRNAVLAKLLADVAGDDGHPVAENRGSGLSRVVQRLRQAGMSPPDFDVTPAHVHVTVPQSALLDPDTVEWIASLGATGLTNDQHLALAMLRARGTVSNRMLRAWGVPSPRATASLTDLVRRGLVVKRGSRSDASYVLEHDDEPDHFRLDPPSVATPAAPSPAGPERRIEAELEAVKEAVRAGHRSSRTIQEAVGLTYPTVMRRLKTLLDRGEIVAAGAPQSRRRSYEVSPEAQ